MGHTLTPFTPSSEDGRDTPHNLLSLQSLPLRSSLTKQNVQDRPILETFFYIYPGGFAQAKDRDNVKRCAVSFGTVSLYMA